MTHPTDDPFGPIDYVVVEFPDGVPAARGFDVLLAAVDAGTIRILDLEIVTKTGDEVSVVEAGRFDALAAFEGASSGLLDAADLALLGEALTDGASAAVVVYEELSVLAALEAWTGDGARVVTEGHLTPADLASALDATEND